MPKVCQDTLQPAPFTTYRDPVTGQWVVQKVTPVYNSRDQFAFFCGQQS